MKLFNKMFGTYSQRELKKIEPILNKVLALDEDMQKLSDDELRAKTDEFKQRYANGETLDELLPEAFATVREASVRVLGMKHFPVQIIGGIVLHQGRIAEMKTGEGKTLVATLPAYLNALSGDGVHIVTVNDYLARRDSEWMGKVYSFLGLSVGLVVHDVPSDLRQAAYNADITYATNNELGFDYLRDNMVIYKSQAVGRGQNFAIVDEVDSILIDEARTPLIISGIGDKSNDLYRRANAFAMGLKKFVVTETDTKKFDDEVDADYIIDEKAKTATLTQRGVEKAEKTFGIENLSDPENMTLSHHINQAIKAHGTMHRDDNYVVKNGEVIIVDEFTGRLMQGRRYSDGLHQAIEAKENVNIQNESKTLATITFQNYFRLYSKLSGMTGTAETEEAEFQSIYKLDVVIIPTNMPLARQDKPDAVYKTYKGKLNAIVAQVKECNAKNQPVLIGTITIEKSEELSKLLKHNGIKHQVLNAKFHEKEAEIISQAGTVGAVTIATNMAGRGTDIMLGGNAEFLAKKEMKKRGFEDDMIVQATSHAITSDDEILQTRATYKEIFDNYKSEIAPKANEVLEAGGLYIIGTERHESRRIDNQLRGRSGRQGDTGYSKFFISLEDDLMRLFGSDRMLTMVNALGMTEDQSVNSPALSRAIETAQRRIEGRNFDARKTVLQYDDVMNAQRETIYKQRKMVLDGSNLEDIIINYLNSVAEGIAHQIITDERFPEDWNWQVLNELSEYTLATRFDIADEMKKNMGPDGLLEILQDGAKKVYDIKREALGDEKWAELQRVVLLQVVDQKWMDHLDDMEQLKQGIYLRAYAQRDPVVEYRFEGMRMFEDMIATIKEDTIRFLLHANITQDHERKKLDMKTTEAFGGEINNTKSVPMSNENHPKQPVVRNTPKVGRNEMCPCGSG
ncbi:MAG: preprotein translocase subunit SecA, partial [Clostridiales bacterium]|nr:preprotein translocase subunit SecA [Clostridiales bacterium]